MVNMSVNGKLDILLELSREQRQKVDDIHDYVMSNDKRITVLEEKGKLQNKLGIALAGLLPPISVGLYFVIGRLF